MDHIKAQKDCFPFQFYNLINNRINTHAQKTVGHHMTVECIFGSIQDLITHNRFQKVISDGARTHRGKAEPAVDV